MIRLRYRARERLWYVDLARPADKARNARYCLWTGPWRTARGAATLDLAAGT